MDDIIILWGSRYKEKKDFPKKRKELDKKFIDWLCSSNKDSSTIAISKKTPQNQKASSKAYKWEGKRKPRQGNETSDSPNAS